MKKTKKGQPLTAIGRSKLRKARRVEARQAKKKKRAN
jgi:hypothetical protein